MVKAEFFCKICDKKFSKDENLDQHIKKAHLVRKDYSYGSHKKLRRWIQKIISLYRWFSISPLVSDVNNQSEAL